jgi:hypothetical protein
MKEGTKLPPQQIGVCNILRKSNTFFSINKETSLFFSTLDGAGTGMLRTFS